MPARLSYSVSFFVLHFHFVSSLYLFVDVTSVYSHCVCSISFFVAVVSNSMALVTNFEAKMKNDLYNNVFVPL
jgi:hypothetical protein